MELIKCNDDGTTDIMFIGRTAKLRRPKIGEFRDLRLMLEDANNDIDGDQTWVMSETVRLAQLSGDERQSEETVAALTELRERTTKVRDYNERIRIDWLTKVCEVLDTASRIPVEDEMPPEVLRGTWPQDLIKHWIGEAPLVPGDGSE